MLGHDLCKAAVAGGHEAVGLTRTDLDLTNGAAVEAAVSKLRPDAVINCAAWTDVDLAEQRELQALAVNGDGAGSVARAAAAADAWMLQISTDYVFDGAKRTPYVESDAVSPLSAYGRSKLAGEEAVAVAAPECHTIVRTSWLFGVHGRSFPATVLKIAAERDQITVVDDQVGCPTFTGHLAQALLELAAGRVAGTVHVAASGSCSWCELAREIVSTAGLDCEVKPGSSSDLDRPAPRPVYSVLETERGSEVPRLVHWREGLATFMGSRVPSP